MLYSSPATLPFAMYAIAISDICAIAFWLVCAGKSGNSAYILARKKDLPSVLPLVLAPTAPMLMVSYTWRAPFVHIARSLASAAPNTWVDV